jgi:hypothetical protein
MASICVTNFLRELIQYLDARERADEEAISKIDANTDANRKKTLPPSKG